MVGYIAKDLDTTVWFHFIKPIKNKDKDMWLSDERMFRIDLDIFPEFNSLSWKDEEPVKVKFDIKILDNDYTL
jgi:hypothetical protein